MTYTDDGHNDLLRIAGSDAHALFLVDALFDYAVNDTPPDLPLLRAHCADPGSQVNAKSMDFLLTTLPEYCREWLWCKTEEDAQAWWKEILAGLHSLRTGCLACRTCLSLGWHVGMVASRVPGSIDCAEHRELCLHDLFAPRTPLALVRTAS